MFRTIGVFLVINCICVFSASKSSPLRTYVCHWTDQAAPIYYLKGANTEPLYRLQKEIGDESIVLVDEKNEKIIGRTSGLSFKIFDMKTQKWISGRIQEQFRLVGYKLNIVWGGMKMTMTGGLARTFYDKNNKILAKRDGYRFQKRFDLEIWSDRIPDLVYIMVLAAHAKIDERST